MTLLAVSIPLRRLLASLVLGGCLFVGGSAGAQSGGAYGLTTLPSFAWPRPETEESRWTGSFARMSTGFQVVSSRRSGSYAGPTLGFEGGRMWQDGSMLYGIVGGFDYLNVVAGGTPRFDSVAYSRDFAGTLQVKVGTLLTPDILVYAKLGALTAHETLRVGASPSSLPFSREDIAVRPDARAGIEWAVTDRVTVGIEAGVTGRALAR